MQKLLSLPPNLVSAFYELENVDRTEWFCTSDPAGMKLGSGGGTAWLLREWYNNRNAAHSVEKRILLHAGGQSRRLPGYAPSGKILTPIPVFRWARGQKLGQNLLSLQLPLYEKIMDRAPENLRTLIASGDVYIRAEKPLQEIPDADVVCYGLWVDPVLATHHGVFVSDRKSPEALDFMLQKPSLKELENLSKTHLFLMDIGIWLLSDRAVELLMKRSQKEEGASDQNIPYSDLKYYDLYSDFGLALGEHPHITDEELNKLSVAILPLPAGEFYHYGTSRELLSSTVTLPNKVYDQRQIMHRKVKPNPAIFIQNAEVHIPVTPKNDNIWIENSYVASSWTLGVRQIITGVPENDWMLAVPDGVCIDIVPVKNGCWAVRPYGFDDIFKGDIREESTLFLGKPFSVWLKERRLTIEDVTGRKDDLQAAAIFPTVSDKTEMGRVLRWMVSEPGLAGGKDIWLNRTRLSADEISAQADLRLLYAQRENFCKGNWEILARNHEKSVFYQLDLADVADEFHKFGLGKPEVLSADAPLMQRVHNRMLRAQIEKLNGKEFKTDEQAAFGLLREGLLSALYERKLRPHLNIYSDQIVWGRSPVRIDMAGGWTDTPPYSLFAGGNVVNIAIELNGQPPLQVYIKSCVEHRIVLRSIDMGAMEVVNTFEELQDYGRVGSPFSIPKAALALAGFVPAFSDTSYPSLQKQLEAFGTGIEITLLSAIPAGSGLGTSSILASTVLGSLSDFCGLMWDKNEICRRTLALEQLLTTGGGWQDQYGGVLQGIKLLQTESGFAQQPLVRWLPEHLFTNPEYKDCHLLYYTGITRIAKGILAEIVRAMFLNSSLHLGLLEEMKAHALDMAEAIQRNDFGNFGALVGKTWTQNKALDCGTNPPEVEAIINRIKDYTLGYKLPGAGGGGYLYMVAKDPQAAVRIREILTRNAPNPRARFVEMSLSDKGFQVSRS
ncbi:bifunctional fucokinase/fucose-1-phosphate guanylyltransferase [Bacteroides helcogenes]|uniref:Fucokinase n=1 Tax=Bacteroides helcogenes (strain ATCC 35417 / DSM 20613 / JCM 6297 / CCUG 15421 / P 36-108) TaxID=693979 RepID=E6SQA0_BACT6|nr:bifunctional fucokinase/fucose-1-phosphate guanylyltransferase [Bacteroides helcogenes]ADV43959.1 Fucokinase [Bacteroides helcogenes P 36-108]MDY5236903.1 bifunctional fucokinase/fucose-1-phosphate guanylyltransferase [Bacteroides helcogenes]